MTGKLVALTPMVFGLSGLRTWVLKEILPIILLVDGITIILKAKAGKWSEVAAMVGITVLGILVIFAADPMQALAEKITSLLQGN